MTSEAIEATDRAMVTRRWEDLKVHPDLAYRLEDKASIESMAGSLQQVGLLHNLVITPDNVIVSGTRRYGGMRLLKWAGLVPCQVVDEDVGNVMAIALAVNSQVQAPDPMRDSELVARLLAPDASGKPGWSIADVSNAMGWSVRRVALLRQLQRLDPSVVEAVKTPTHFMAKWPIEWLEEFACLSLESQRDALNESRFKFVTSKSHLEHILGDYFHVLEKAPWDVNDETLHPVAGSCTKCPKHSGNAPGLFEDAIEDGGSKSLVCRDAGCWAAKANACAIKKIAEARAKNQDTAIVVGQTVKGKIECLAHEAVHDSFAVQKCARSEAGAVPAIEFKDDGSIAKCYIKPPRIDGRKTVKGSAAKIELSEEQKLEARRASLLARRQRLVSDAVIMKIRGLKAPPGHLVMMGLCSAYGVTPPMAESGAQLNLHGSEKKRRELYALSAEHDKWDAALWPRLKRDMIASIESMHGSIVEDEFREAIWLAGILLGQTKEELWRFAETEIPTPKALAQEKAKPRKKRSRAEDGFQNN